MSVRRSASSNLPPPSPNNLDAEKSIVGAVLINNYALARARQIVSPEDFFLPQHRHLFQTFIYMERDGQPIDIVTVNERLQRDGELESAGGVAYIASLTDGVPKVSNVEHYAQIVKNKALLRDALHTAEAIKKGVYNREERDQIQKRFASMAEQLKSPNGRARVFSAAEVANMSVKKREFLLEPWITTKSIGEIYAKRGVGKTFAAIAIAHAIGCAGSWLRYKAPSSAKVLYVDGELDEATLQDRIKSLGAINNRNLEFLCVDQQDEPFPHLAQARAQNLIEDHLADKKLLVLDNLSALAPSTNETEAEEWITIQSWLLSLRKKGISSFFVHHAGHAGHSRGTTRREDLLDWVVQLAWPNDYNPADGLRFEMKFTKDRAYMRGAASPIEAKLNTDECGQGCWTFTNLENARLGQIVELHESGNTWRQIENITGIPRSTAERIFKKSLSGNKVKA